MSSNVDGDELHEGEDSIRLRFFVAFFFLDPDGASLLPEGDFGLLFFLDPDGASLRPEGDFGLLASCAGQLCCLRADSRLLAAPSSAGSFDSAAVAAAS